MAKILWTIVILGLVIAVVSVFGLSGLLLKELVRYSLTADLSWPYWWQPWVGYPVALLTLFGSGWLLWIALKVVVSLARPLKQDKPLD
jgi:hypothetical protein